MILSELNKMRILLGVTGSIAAIKLEDLIKQLQARKAEIKLVLTKSAQHFVELDKLRSLLGSEHIYTEEDLFGHQDEMLHITLARFAEIILVAPASANFIARLAGGFADDLLSTVCVASAAKIMIAPAMNQQMWANKFTQLNVKKITEQGVGMIGPDSGLQACGDVGLGRMTEPEEIVKRLFKPQILKGKVVMITAGGTREYIDPVRYITNSSSGKMGYALARAATDLGATVVLISAKTSLPKPAVFKFVEVTSAEQMYEQVMQRVKEVDIFIGAAAVSDYTPAEPSSQKVKKKTDNLSLTLKPTIDILATVANMKESRPYTVGFAAETNNLIEYATKKLINKNLDMIIANDVSDNKVFDRDENEVVIITKEKQKNVSRMSKERVAEAILESILDHTKFNESS